MTWAEFQIRAFAYQRMQEREDLRAREIAWSALIGSHYNPKKLPKNKDAFWKIGKKVSKVTDDIRNKIKQAQEQYLREKNGS